VSGVRDRADLPLGIGNLRSIEWKGGGHRGLEVLDASALTCERASDCW
jgi:hypothetical protein